MREGLLIIVVAVLCVTALVKPKYGVLAYTWFALMRPDVLSWSVGVPYSMALAVCTLIGALPHIFRFGILFSTPLSRWLILFLVPITLSAANAVNPALSWPAWYDFIRIVIMALLIPVFITTERDFQILLAVIGGSVAILGLKLALYGLFVGDAQFIDDFAGTMMGDNNMLALALAMAAPLCWYSALIVKKRWMRLAFFGLALGSVGGVVMTNSRGGALSAGVAILAVALRSKRKLGTVVVIAVCLSPVVYVVHDTYFKRLSTITADEDKADGSIKARLNHRRAAYAMWKDYPFLGVGFGMENYAKIAPRYLGYDDFHVAHNTYFQILADDGIFAILIYVGMLFGTILWLQKSIRQTKDEYPGKEIYPIAMQASLLAFSVGCYFLSRDSYDLLYIALMAAAAWRNLARNGEWDDECVVNSDDGHAELEMAAGVESYSI
jgi:probable O-glycosylation ligase (exosortase A-associated)